MQKSRTIFVAVMIAILAAGALAQEQAKPSPPGTASFTFADGKTVTITTAVLPCAAARSSAARSLRTGLANRCQLRHQPEDRCGPYDWRSQRPSGNLHPLLHSGREEAGSSSSTRKPASGAPKYDEKQDLARVDMKVSKNASPTEQFTISFDQTNANAAVLKLDWADTTARVDVAVKK